MERLEEGEEEVYRMLQWRGGGCETHSDEMQDIEQREGGVDGENEEDSDRIE